MAKCIDEVDEEEEEDEESIGNGTFSVMSKTSTLNPLCVPFPGVWQSIDKAGLFYTLPNIKALSGGQSA